MSRKRVVITGIGIVSPLGLTVESNWKNLISGKSGISLIEKFNTDKYSTKIAGQISGISEDYIISNNYIDAKDLKKMDLFIHYGLVAASDAILDSGWNADSEEKQNRTGVILGSGIGGLASIEAAAIQLHHGTGKVSPFFIPSCLINLLSGHLSIKYGYKGPNHAVVTACATGANAIGDAARIIQYGDADIMIAGGSEAPICELGVAGFSAARALSTSYNDAPQIASRPWDKKRVGFVMGEGAGIVVLEELEHARARGAKIYAEIVGYGMAGDAYHITSTHPEGLGGLSAMKRALKDAGISEEMVGYINAHGTSTPVGDASELAAVQSLFYEANQRIKMSSTKSAIGHLLGAAGSVEAIYTALALRDQILPPTLNLDEQMDEVKIDLVPHNAKDHSFDYALTNSFGFGGTNTCLALKKFV